MEMHPDGGKLPATSTVYSLNNVGEAHQHSINYKKSKINHIQKLIHVGSRRGKYCERNLLSVFWRIGWVLKEHV